MCRITTISKLNSDRSNEHQLKHNESCNKAQIYANLLFYERKNIDCGVRTADILSS
jgi:hypothetical protein